MLSSICIILLGAAGVYSFPTGAPITLCNDPFPGHGAQASTTESPYTISVSDSQYQPDQIINITISADADDIRGFSIGVHSVSGAWERLYGEFTSTPDNTVSYQYYSMESNCVTHGQNYTRMNSISFQWKAPNVSVGDLTISATIVKNYNTFWLNQTVSLTAAQSAENGAVTPARMITSGAANLDSDLSLEMCGNKSGCMTRPQGCAGDDCEVVLSHKSVSGGVRFRLTLRQDDMTSSFVALGISEDQSMPDDETVSCLDFAGRYAINQGFNPARFNVKAQSEEISDVVMHTVDGALTCEFTRRLQSSFTYYGLAGPAVYDVDYTPSLNTPNYYLYVAWGKPYAGTREAAGMHSTLPEISKNKVAFSSKSRMLFKSQDLDEDTTISSTTTDSGAAANVMSFVMVAALGVVRVL